MAERYQELITDLGMEISMSKSYVSRGIAEFAKSLFLNGANLKPFSWEILMMKPQHFLPDTQLLLEELSERNIWVPLSNYIEALFPSMSAGLAE